MTSANKLENEGIVVGGTNKTICKINLFVHEGDKKFKKFIKVIKKRLIIASTSIGHHMHQINGKWALFKH